LRNWSARIHADAVDTTNFESTNGKRENIEGLGNVTISAEGPLDQGSWGLVVGTSYTFSLNAGSSVFNCTARITDCTPSVAVDGVAVVSIEAVSTGDFTATIT
jgi:hypothetical protein